MKYKCKDTSLEESTSVLQLQRTSFFGGGQGGSLQKAENPWCNAIFQNGRQIQNGLLCIDV